MIVPFIARLSVWSVLCLTTAEVLAMSRISANDLKTRGIAAIEASLADQPEAIVSVRGKDRFVVMDIE